MYEPSKIMQSFFIAGFQYHDGALALKKLKLGKKLELIAEPDNPHDPDAVAIYRKGVHLGYVPGDSNATIAQLLRFGHANVLECRIMQVDKKGRSMETSARGNLRHRQSQAEKGGIAVCSAFG